MEIAQVDLDTVTAFAARVSALAKYRLKLHGYLCDKMTNVAPNLGMFGSCPCVAVLFLNFYVFQLP